MEIMAIMDIMSMEAQPVTPGLYSSLVKAKNESLKLEGPFLKVPYEYLKRTMRGNGKSLEKELKAIMATMSEPDPSTKEETDEKLDNLVSQLQGLKRKLGERSLSEQEHVQRCRARLDHLAALGSSIPPGEWGKVRLNRILVDFMLRSSHFMAAKQLAESANIKDLVELEVFVDAQRVVEGLRAHDCSEALAWCNENKAKLKKGKSKLEFNLRVQEFIELVRTEQVMAAVLYARVHLAPWGQLYLKELQQAMATLAFRSATDCSVYKAYFQDERWDFLLEQFKEEHSRLHSMSTQSLLDIYLQAGLSALKTPFCFEAGCPQDDPLSQESYQKMAEGLPFAKHIHSKLICHITKDLMNDKNPPLLLPNGNVYSQKALEEMALKNNGMVKCPRTGMEYPFTEVSKIYIS